MTMGINALLVTIIATVTLADSAGVPRVAVTETDGVYQVTAGFVVSEPPSVVMSVLTDYERIPLFMPDMEVSKVIERSADGAVVEQQAVSRFMLFSRRVHLELVIREGDGTISFRDRSGKSFSSYEGGWTISQRGSQTVVTYTLTAKPMFEVPSFVLKRLLKRDSSELIDRLQVEITQRADRSK
jgi:ribosome-associated toxin RatA of RatAB toxin-antitoxin module